MKDLFAFHIGPKGVKRMRQEGETETEDKHLSFKIMPRHSTNYLTAILPMPGVKEYFPEQECSPCNQDITRFARYAPWVWFLIG